MKRFYIAAFDSENGKNYAYVLPVSENNNLCARLAEHKNMVAANLCPTRKAANSLVIFWNNCFRQNGTYLYSTKEAPLF